MGAQDGQPLTGPCEDLIVSLPPPPILGMGMGTRTLGTTAPQCPTAPSRTQTAMDRVMPAMRMTTTTESLTIGTTAAWCPTRARKTQIVRQGVGQGCVEPLGQVFKWANGRYGRGQSLEWAGLGMEWGAWR